MPEVTGTQKLFSVLPTMRLGLPREFGRSMFGFSKYGAECELFDIGNDETINVYGIYKRVTRGPRLIVLREPYYIPRNPRSIPQQAQRNKMTSAVAEWQALTNNQKSIYNEKAKGKHMYGYNVFLSEYLLSH